MSLLTSKPEEFIFPQILEIRKWFPGDADEKATQPLQSAVQYVRCRYVIFVFLFVCLFVWFCCVILHECLCMCGCSDCYTVCAIYQTKGECADMNCPKQHHSPRVKPASAPPPMAASYGKDDDAQALAFCRHLWATNGGDAVGKLIKATAVSNPGLSYEWHKFHQPANGDIWAFHGTNVNNLQSICSSGFDPQKCGSAVGQAFGAGFYFARNPQVSAEYYVKGGKKMLIVRLSISPNSMQSLRHIWLMSLQPSMFNNICIMLYLHKSNLQPYLHSSLSGNNLVTDVVR